MRTRTVVVIPATYPGALNLWISLKTLPTRTNRFVILDATVSISTTRARVLTDVVDARFVVRTFAVRDTSGYDR